MSIITAPDLVSEQVVLSAAMFAKDHFAKIADRVVPADFSELAHQSVFAAMLAIAADGGHASLHVLIASVDDYEITDGLRLHAYLRRMVKDYFDLMHVPLDDAIDAMLDASRRRTLVEVGGMITAASKSTASTRVIASRAIEHLDGVLASIRQSKRTLLTAGGAAAAAIVYAESQDRPYPTTGLIDLDGMLGGWPRGQLSIVAGRPGMGKSAFGLSSAIRTAKSGHAVAMFSLEMQQVQIGARALTDIAYTHEAPLNYSDVLARRVDDSMRRRLDAAADELAALPVQIDEQRGLTISEIVVRSHKMAEKATSKGHPLEVVMVDHIGLVRASSRYAGNRVREIAEITDGLATLAKDLDVAVVGLCQLNRAVEGRENKRPSLADLRDSGAIEEDASAVVFAFRPAYYLETQRFDDPATESDRRAELSRVKHKLELIVAKNRNGLIGTVDCFVDIGANAIRNASYAR